MVEPTRPLWPDATRTAAGAPEHDAPEHEAVEHLPGELWAAGTLGRGNTGPQEHWLAGTLARTNTGSPGPPRSRRGVLRELKARAQEASRAGECTEHRTRAILVAGRCSTTLERSDRHHVRPRVSSAHDDDHQSPHSRYLRGHWPRDDRGPLVRGGVRGASAALQGLREPHRLGLRPRRCCRGPWTPAKGSGRCPLHPELGPWSRVVHSGASCRSNADSRNTAESVPAGLHQLRRRPRRRRRRLSERGREVHLLPALVQRLRVTLNRTWPSPRTRAPRLRTCSARSRASFR